MSEFKAFLLKTNALALAVGVILGTATGKVVSSLVSDVLMPPIGLLVGNIDFERLFIAMGPGRYETLAAAKEAGVPTVNYGLFVSSIVDFVMIAFVVFLVTRHLLKPAPAVPGPPTKACGQCGETILAVAKRCPRCTGTP